jgi:LysM repeat protein
MQLKALTAILAIAAITAVSSSAGHAEALSQTSTPSNTNNKVKVAPGDTLSAIAGRHQTSYARLFDANPEITDPNLIFPGEVLRIPKADEQLPDRFKPAPTTVSSSESATAPAMPSAPRPAPVVSASASGVWTALAKCESGGDWAANTGNGFYGGLQFTLSSWQAAGGSGYPSQASASEQVARAQILKSRQGWGAWPACAAELGLR